MAAPTPTLIVIDVQRALDDPSHGERSNPAAERNIARAIEAWREGGAPVIHVRHESEGLFAPGSDSADVNPEAMPRAGEPVLTKNANSAFIGTDLEQRLRAEGVETDGELIPAETMHRTALASLHGEFAEVLETDEALARVAGASRAA